MTKPLTILSSVDEEVPSSSSKAQVSCVGFSFEVFKDYTNVFRLIEIVTYAATFLDKINFF